jgi:hypothetical protein
MENLSILKGLFDEKIISILNLFIENPYKQHYLSEISSLSKINVSTTFRVLNKLTTQGFLKVTLVGKVKMYQLEKSDKAHALVKFLKKDKEGPLELFIERVKTDPKVKLIILESNSSSEAKLLIVGDSISKEKVQKIADELKDKNNFKISFVELFENQFNELKNFSNYDLNSKIVWKRE